MCAIKQCSSRSESTRGESTSLALLAAVTGQISLACKVQHPGLASHASAPGVGFWCRAAAAWDVHTLGMGREDLVLKVHGVSPGSLVLSGLLIWQTQGLPCASGRRLVAVIAA